MNALARFAAGDLDSWEGLPDGVTRERAAEALGAADPQRDLGGVFAGEPRVFRRHFGNPPAPAGVDVWFSDDTAVAISYGPADVLPPEAPESVVDDGFSRRYVYARRGLMLDVARDGARRARGRIRAMLDRGVPRRAAGQRRLTCMQIRRRRSLKRRAAA